MQTTRTRTHTHSRDTHTHTHRYTERELAHKSHIAVTQNTHTNSPRNRILYIVLAIYLRVATLAGGDIEGQGEVETAPVDCQYSPAAVAKPPAAIVFAVNDICAKLNRENVQRDFCN